MGKVLRLEVKKIVNEEGSSFRTILCDSKRITNVVTERVLIVEEINMRDRGMTKTTRT